ncbi:MAG: hypothetical protein AAB933_02645 [Patescibacteria group bacterium]
MNLKHKLNPNLIVALFGAMIIISALIFSHPPENPKDIKLTEKGTQSLKEIQYEELSPNSLYKIISYNFTFDLSIYKDYYKDYFYNDMVISVQDMEDGSENYIFTGSRIGEPKWLGNEHIFFTSYCGSSCKGIYLINVLNKETEQGVLSYMISGDDKPVFTYFKDWFDKEFKFDGWVEEIKSEIVNDKVYLIFYMIDDEHKSLGQKRFLFTEKALAE